MNSWFVLLSEPLLPPGDREFLHRMFLACVLSAAALRAAGVWDGVRGSQAVALQPGPLPPHEPQASLGSLGWPRRCDGLRKGPGLAP